MAVNPTFSGFDMPGCCGFALGMFWFCFWRVLCHTAHPSRFTERFHFELVTLPSAAALFLDRRWIKNNPKRLKIKHVIFCWLFYRNC